MMLRKDIMTAQAEGGIVMGENVAGYGYGCIGTSAATILVLFILLVIILSVF